MKILITGASGMVGQNLLPILKTQSQNEIFAPTRQELNLLNKTEVVNYFKQIQPHLIIHLAAKVGGIQANINQPVEFLAENLSVGLNIVLAALEAQVPNFLNVGSSCIYPRDREILREEDILTGSLEPTNEGYALAKISILRLCEYITKQYAYHYKTIIPCNIYGPYDNFDLLSGHLVPAMLHKLYQAKQSGNDEVVIWGDGKAKREFMFVDDLVDFIRMAINKIVTLPSCINVGLGFDYSINEYYAEAAQIVGYEGSFTHDLTKPVGMKKKLLDVTKASQLGWQAKTNLVEGLQQTYQFFVSKQEK